MAMQYMNGFNSQDIASVWGVDYPGNDVNSGAGFTTSVVTTNPRRSGGKSFKFTSTGATQFGGHVWTAPTSFASIGTTWVHTVYLRFNSMTLAANGNWCSILGIVNSANTAFMGLALDGGASPVFQRTTSDATNGALVTSTGLAATTGQWYRVQFTVNSSAATWTWSVKIFLDDSTSAVYDSGSLNYTPGVGAQTTVFPITYGIRGQFSNLQPTLDMQITDLVFGSGTTPIGPIEIHGYLVDGVGTHNLDASPSKYMFSYVGGVATALTVADTTSWANLDNLPFTSNNGVDGISFNDISSSSATGAATAAAITGTWTSIANAQGAPQNAIGAAFTITNAASIAVPKSGSVVAALSAWTGLQAAVNISSLTVNVRAAASAAGLTGQTIKIDLYNLTTLVQAGSAQPMSATTYADYAQTFSGVSVPSGNLVIRVTAAKGSTNTTETFALDGAVIASAFYSAATPSSANYAEYTLANETTLTADPIAVQFVYGVGTDNAGGATSSCSNPVLVSSAGSASLEGSARAGSAAGVFFPYKMMDTNGFGGTPWTLSEMNSMKIRLLATQSVFVSGIVTAMLIPGVLMEAAFVPGASGSTATPARPRVVGQAVTRAATR